MKFPSNVQDLTDQYEKYLDEVIDRLWIVVCLSQRLSAGKVTNEYPQIDLDLIVIQLRKSLEVVGYMCLFASQPGLGKFSKNIRKKYNPNDVFKFLKDKNNKFYPKAVEIVTNQDGQTEFKFRQNKGDTQDWLTQEEFLKVYDKFCGDRAHAKHEYLQSGNNTFYEDVKYAHTIALKLKWLVGHHIIQFGDKYMISAGANGPKGGAIAEFYSNQGLKSTP